MVMIVPSRNRPGNIQRLLRAWPKVTSANTKLVVRVDADDETLPDYHLLDVAGSLFEPEASLVVGKRGSLTEILNELAVKYAANFDAVGFIGDDCLPRTRGWDRMLTDALASMGSGIAFPADGIHNGGLPCHIVMSSSWVQTLGWFAQPSIRHLFIDNVWGALGRQVGRLHYCRNVLVEHLHPIVQKAEWDDVYRTVNAGAMYEAGQAAYDEYLLTTFRSDVAKLEALIARETAA